MVMPCYAVLRPCGKVLGLGPEFSLFMPGASGHARNPGWLRLQVGSGCEDSVGGAPSFQSVSLSLSEEIHELTLKNSHTENEHIQPLVPLWCLIELLQ